MVQLHIRQVAGREREVRSNEYLREQLKLPRYMHPKE